MGTFEVLAVSQARGEAWRFKLKPVGEKWVSGHGPPAHDTWKAEGWRWKPRAVVTQKGG